MEKHILLYSVDDFVLRLTVSLLEMECRNERILSRKMAMSFEFCHMKMERNQSNKQTNSWMTISNSCVSSASCTYLLIKYHSYSSICHGTEEVKDA